MVFGSGNRTGHAGNDGVGANTYTYTLTRCVPVGAECVTTAGSQRAGQEFSICQGGLVVQQTKRRAAFLPVMRLSCRRFSMAWNTIGRGGR